MPAPFTTPVAGSVPFEPNRNPQYDGNTSSSGLTSNNLQDAVEEAKRTAPGVLSKPSFTWGNSGSTPNGSYLQNDTVPSNRAGRIVPLGLSLITNVFVASQDSDTFSITIQKRVGNTFTNIVTVNVVASRVSTTTVSVPVNVGDELACMVSSGSPKNPVVGLIVAGTP